MTWLTTEYPAADGCHLTGRPWGDPEPCPVCSGPYYAPEHRRAEVHRDLRADELPTAVFAIEASDDRAAHWASNGLRWTDPEAARTWGGGLVMRWLGMTDCRLVRLAEPPTDDRNEYTVAEVIDVLLSSDR